MADTYDSPWKRALKRYLPDFVTFFFRQQCEEIDWRRAPRLRDKELSEAYRDGRPHTLIADILASVFLNDGREALLHIEVQAQRDPKLARRIFEYNYWLCKSYHLPVASMVVLADAGGRWHQDIFHASILGTGMRFSFAVAKLTAYAELIDELLLERNVFAWVTAAHLLAQQTRGRPEARFAAKWRLVRLLYERGWRRRRIIDLFMVIHWLMKLPAELDAKLLGNIRRLERRHSVEWLSAYDQLRMEKREKRGEKRGIKTGRAEGLLEGRQEGRREGAAEVLGRQLHRRFGALSPTVQKRLAKASPEQLAQWSEAVLDAQTLKQVFSSRP